MMCGAVLTTRSQSNPGSNPRRDQINVNMEKTSNPRKNPAVAGKIVTICRLSPAAVWKVIMGLLVSRIDGVAAGEVTRQMGLGFCQLGQWTAGVTLPFNF